MYLIRFPHPRPLPEGEGILKAHVDTAKIRVEHYWLLREESEVE